MAPKIKKISFTAFVASDGIVTLSRAANISQQALVDVRTRPIGELESNRTDT